MTRYLFSLAWLFLALPIFLSAQKHPTNLPSLAQIQKMHDDYYYREALPLWQKALPRYEKSKDTVAWITCLWGIADAVSRLRKPYESDSLHKICISLLERIPRQKDSDLWARVYSDYAKNCLVLPDTTTCGVALQRAIREAEPFWGKPQFFYGAYNYNNLGIHYENTKPNDTTLALNAYLKSIAAYEASDIGMERMHVTRHNLVKIYENRNDKTNAQKQWKLLVQWVENTPPKGRLGDMEVLYSRLTSYYQSIGQVSKAEYYYKESEKWLLKRYGSVDFNLAALYYDISIFYSESKRYTQSLLYLEKGLKTAYALSAAPNRLHIALRMSRVDANAALKNFAAAATDIERLKEEIALQKNEVDFYMPYLHDKQAYYHKQKGELAESLKHYQRILVLLKAPDEKGNDPYIVRPALVEMTRVLKDMNQPQEALVHAERTLRLFFVNRPPATTELSLIHVPDSLLIWDFELSHTVNLWLSLLLQTNDPKNIERAWANSLRVIQINEKFRRQRIGLDEQDFALWIDQLRNTYELALEVAQARYQQTKDPQFLTAQFQLCERFNTIKITESAVNVQAQTAAGIPEALLAQLQQLQNEITDRENTLAMLPQGIPAFDSLLYSWKTQHQAILANVESRYPRYHQMKYEIPETNIADIQQALPDDALFISYFIHKDRKHIDIFTIDKKAGLTITPAQVDSNLRSVVLDMHKMAQSVLLNRQTTRERFLKQAHTLYQQLLTPIEAQMASKNHLLIVPDDFLYYVPFEVLIKDPAKTTFHQADFLVKKANISYQYSGRLYANAPKNTPVPEAKELFAFAPIFAEQATHEGIASVRTFSNKEVSLRALNKRGEFTPLPYSEYEVNAIGRLFLPDKATISVSADAHESTLKQALQAPYRLVHIASHSFTNLRYPKFSGIACTPEKDTTKEGILYANEIYNLNAQADLVVLSSCESGIGKLNEDEGMLGLNRAFAYAGVPNIIYSLWKVNDKATSELMVELYKQILAGKSYAAALRAAKLKMLEKPVTASPNFWSGFLLMGQ